MSLGWFNNRFEQSERKVLIHCEVCGRAMYFPPSKAGQYVTCGGGCANARYAAMNAPQREKTPPRTPREWQCAGCGKQMLGGKATARYCNKACWQLHREEKTRDRDAVRARNCAHCAAVFVPKLSQIKAGVGKYCSRTCATSGGAFQHLVERENLEKANAARLKSIQENGTKHRKGAANPNWKGGRAATRQRRGGAENQYRREYRKKNRERVLEFSRRRQQRKTGRLPRGTIQRIGTAQRWRCAICAVSIISKYHMDHIMPLAKGGGHLPGNIQLLCPACNVRKSDKHPIDYMQERGFLL